MSIFINIDIYFLKECTVCVRFGTFFPTRTFVPHGHSEKTNALRADLLNAYFYLQDGHKN
jgi:hypothetical protein